MANFEGCSTGVGRVLVFGVSDELGDGGHIIAGILTSKLFQT